jgi:hypothetical protein
MLSSAREEQYTDLLDEILSPIARHRDEAQRRLDEIAGRRTAMPDWERAAAREAAVELRDELARLDLLTSLITRLLQPAERTEHPESAHPAEVRRVSMISRRTRP